MKIIDVPNVLRHVLINRLTVKSSSYPHWAVCDVDGKSVLISKGSDLADAQIERKKKNELCN